MIHISGGALILFALMLMVLPIPWILAAFLAAALHELAHILTVILLGGRVNSFHIGIGGAQIRAYLPDKGSTFFSILAGPLCSLLLFLFSATYPRLAVCGIIQGIFNLLPVYPFDGGRLLAVFLSGKALRIIYSVFLIAISLILTVSIIYWGSLSDLFLCIMLLLPLMRNFPCKDSGIGVQ